MRQNGTKRETRIGLLAAGVGSAYLLPLLGHGVVGLFSRYMADDFCVAAVARDLGLIRAEVQWYWGSSGRYSYLLLVNGASLIGPGVAPILPAVLICLWLAALAWSLTQLGPRFRTSPLSASLLATVLVSATLSAPPNIAQSLYWRNSSLTYTAPLIAGSLLAGVALRQGSRPGHPARWLIVLLLAFFAGGFSEIYAALQFAAFGLALVAAASLAWRGRGWRACGPWLAGLLGSTLALAAIALAPGSRARQATFGAAPGLWPLLVNSLTYAGWFMRDAVLQQAPLLVAVAAVCAGVAMLTTATADEPSAPARRWMWAGLLALPLITFALLVVCYAPAFYALLYLPPDRVLIIPWSLLIVATAAWGFVAGLLAAPAFKARAARLPEPASAAIAIVIAAVVVVPPILASIRTAGELPTAQSYASTWDSYDQMLKSARANGGGTITLARLTTPGHIDNLSDDPSFWANQCVAQYYGVQVRAIAPPPLPAAADLARRTPIHALIGGVAQVSGFHLDQSVVRAGEALSVTVYWLPMANTDKPLTVFVHLYDPAAGSLGQFDAYPGNGQYPTTLWIHGQPFADTYRIPIRAGVTSARATLILGLYDLQTGRRLPVTGVDAGPPGQD